MFDLLKANETPKPDVILRRMSEDGVCILTGETKDLTYMPVDTNVGNILPSNMACVSMAIAKEVEYTCFYEATLGGRFKIIFDTPPVFREYNETVVKGMALDSAVHSGTTKAIDLFGILAKKHAKGIHSIEDQVDRITIDISQYQSYVMRVLTKQNQEQKSKSKIITPASQGINIVK